MKNGGSFHCYVSSPERTFLSEDVAWAEHIAPMVFHSVQLLVNHHFPWENRHKWEVYRTPFSDSHVNVLILSTICPETAPERRTPDLCVHKDLKVNGLVFWGKS